ncbi:hypothetical protein MTO96_028369 [Rhipicephalus appendiculatus]
MPIGRNMASASDDPIAFWLKLGALDKLEQALLDGYGDQLRGRSSRIPQVARFLKQVPAVQAQMEEMHEGAMQGRLEEVRHLAEERRQLAYCRDQQGASPLHKAVLFHQRPLVAYFVQHFPAVMHSRDHQGRTPLHYAAVLQDKGEIYRMLKTAGSDENATDVYGHTPDFYLDAPGELTLEQLKEEPAGLKVQIREIIGQGNLEALEELVLHGHGDRLLGETSPQPGRTGEQISDVHRAVVRGRLREVQTLMSHRSLSLARDSMGATPIHKAVMHGHVDVAQHLAENFRDSLSAKDIEGRTPLHYAAALRDGRKMYNMLIAAGSPTTIVDSKGKTADYYLQYPEKLGLEQIIKRNQLANATHLGNTVSRLKALAPPPLSRLSRIFAAYVIPSATSYVIMYPYASTEFIGGTPSPSGIATGQPSWYGEGFFPAPSPSMPSYLISPSPSPLAPVYSSPSPPWPTFTPSLTPSPNPTEPFPYPTPPYPMIVPSPQPYMPMAAPLPFANAVPYPIAPPLPTMHDANRRKLDRESRRDSLRDSRLQSRRKRSKGRDRSRRRRKSSPSATKLPARRQRRDSDATPSSTSIGKLLTELAALDRATSAGTAPAPPIPRSVRPRALVLPSGGLKNLSGASFFRVPRNRRPRARDALENSGWDVLLQMVSDEFPIANARAVNRPAAGRRPSGSAASARAAAVQGVSGSPPASSLAPRGDCATDSCLWEGQYLLGKIDYRIPPCQDFYAHVCSDNWFKDARNFNSHPFAYRASSALMLDLWRLLQRHPVNESTFASHAALIMRRCVPEPSNGSPDWRVLRQILGDLSIAEWPYVDALPSTDIHNIAMVADKMLGLSTVVRIFLKERPADHEILLHLDSPPILLRRHEDIFPGEDTKSYEAFVTRVLSLLKPTTSYTRNIVLEIVRLEQRLSDAAAHSARSVPVLHVVRPIMQVRSYPHWNWNLYFSYFLNNNDGRHSSTKIVLLDAVYFERLSSILSQATSRMLANYIGYKLLVHLSPLLPFKSAEFMVPLSHQYNSAGGVPARIEACMYLVERLYPPRHKELARFEMRQSAATAPWLTQDEADVAVLKIDRLQTVLVPAYRDLELHYPLLDQPGILLSPDQYIPVLETYYNLVRTLRALYWSTSNLTWFGEPLLPSESAFRAGFSYDPSLNRLSLSPATVAFVAGMSRSIDHNAVPFFLGQLLRGMFSVMDVRGSTVDADGDFRGWWSSTSEDRFLGRARCLQGSFGAAARHFVQDGLAASVFLEENVMDGATLRPLHSVFSRVVKKRGDESAAIAGQPRDLTLKRLFFVNWASTLCEPPASHATDASRLRLRYKIGVPARMRVNVALSRFLPFAEAFSCPPGSRMNPVRSCAFW